MSSTLPAISRSGSSVLSGGGRTGTGSTGGSVANGFIRPPPSTPSVRVSMKSIGSAAKYAYRWKRLGLARDEFGNKVHSKFSCCSVERIR